MSKKQVIVLWIIAAALVATLGAMRGKLSQSPESVTKFARGEKLVSGLDLGKVSKVVVSGDDETTTLTKGAEQWSVAERQDYPADQAKLARAVEELAGLEAVQAYEAGPKYDPRFGMDGEADTAEDHGVQVELIDGSGESLLKASLGKDSNAVDMADPMSMMSAPRPGRYVRVSTDPGTVYVVSESLRAFAGDPAAWLDKEFLKVAKIKSITLRAPEDAEFEPWTVTREDEAGTFSLEGLGENEEMQPNAITPFNTLFANLRFEDVVAADRIEAEGNEQTSRQAVITTFEGFTYTITITPKKAAADLSEDDFNPSAENSFLTLTVSADLPQERPKKPEESEEEAKAADEAFAAEKSRLQEKLEREQGFQGRTFEVTSWALNALLKTRAELVQPRAEEAAQQSPPAGATAVSPPVQVPFAPVPTEEEGE